MSSLLSWTKEKHFSLGDKVGMLSMDENLNITIQFAFAQTYCS